MRFDVDHLIAAPLEDVATALGEPGFYDQFADSLADRGADAPKIAAPELLERTQQGDHVVVKVRSAFVGDLPAAVTKVVEPDKLTWITTLTVRAADRATDLVLVPEHYAGMLDCSGLYRFSADGAGTKEVIGGDLSVHVPIVGKSIERAIFGGIEQYLAAEAAALAAWAGPPS